MQEMKQKSDKDIFEEAVRFNMDYLFRKCDDKLKDDELRNFICAMARTTINFMLANNHLMPDDRIPVNMMVRELADAIQTDLESYVDYLDDFFRKAVE